MYEMGSFRTKLTRSLALWFLGLVLFLAIGPSASAIIVRLDNDERTIALNAPFVVSGVAYSTDGPVTNISVHLGTNKVAELNSSGSSVGFDILVTNSIPGDIPLTVFAKDTFSAVRSNPVLLHFAQRGSIRITSPANNATVFIGREVRITAEAGIDYGSIRAVGFLVDGAFTADALAP